jgi:hypothetical protein
VKFRTPVGIQSRKSENWRERDREKSEVNIKRISQRNAMYLYGFWSIVTQL